MGAIPVPKLSVEEYLAIDRAAEIPSEYHDGEVFPIEAVSLRHAMIDRNLLVLLSQGLRKTACQALGSAVRVRVSPTKYLIPDMMVVCGKPAVTDDYQDAVTNPRVILEILSPSTSGYDYTDKFMFYRRLESFEEYLLAAQDRPRVEVFRKTSNVRWILNTYEGLDACVQLESLGISLPMADIYEGVELSEL
jgi:Uma2 family endonuclease